ncbi:MAG: Phosphoenolpyruvate synthase/pyruvate phosphate dikinase [Candidatus Magasanikbacteria bacterium GW2011_GWA2_56_11]|uniref:Phosphoenolpyruvate synthase/pyruvate phosphate dikinase n=1 Tax=Candidatus Magasanikbacteria bacterium GW2011_GWA2_56_11 TaxID=1619044 RepID=A0A0G1YEH6_9BACT|nr:MAG: Phosphoenolpyruvate synthase/pyruvate phosphate dikinase [Candidatus Magasanikbacteria bacterium GW2011_GWA2_56_11]
MTRGNVDLKVLWYLPGSVIEYAHQTGVGKNLQDGFIHFAAGGAVCYFPVDQIEAYVDELVEKVVRDRLWVKEIHDKCRAYNAEYFASAREVEHLDLLNLSNTELAAIGRRLSQMQEKSHMIAVSTTWLVDSNGETFSKMVMAKLRRALPEESGLEPMYTYSILSTPTATNFTLDEERDFISLAKHLAADPVTRAFFTAGRDLTADFALLSIDAQEAIKAHADKWCWVPYTYVGPAYALGHYLEELRQLFSAATSLDELEADALSRLKTIAEKQTEILSKFYLPDEVKYLLDITREIIWLKDYRKYCMYYGCYVLDRVHRESARRLALSLSQVNHLTADELAQALSGGPCDGDLLNERKKLCVLSYTAGRQEILTGQAAADFLAAKKIEQPAAEPNADLRGTCACPGHVQGTVKIINRPEEMDKMNLGDILVAHTTFPSLLPAMKKAAAIVTEDGGVTCHAAIVAREFNIPCVVGIRKVTQLVRDGDIIEVDAIEGFIKRIA